VPETLLRSALLWYYCASEMAPCFAQKILSGEVAFSKHLFSWYPEMMISIPLFEWDRSGILNTYG
jgi:hypothetical protein